MGEAMAEVHRQILLQRAVRAVRPEEGWESLVPEHYHDFGDVFSKKASERMPTRKPYDHAIELVDGATLPPPAKNYSLSHQERNSLDEWIKENLQKGYIRPSKSDRKSTRLNSSHSGESRMPSSA